MKRIISLFLIIALCFTLTPGTASAAVKINKKSLTLDIGKTSSLKISGTNKAVKWTSSNKEIVTVSSKGNVTAIAGGTTTVTATVNKKKYICKITVNYDIESMLTNTYNWIVSDLWNDSFCDIYHYVESGYDACGKDLDINKSIANADKAMEKCDIYDDFIDSLDDTDYKELKELWSEIRIEINYLYERIKSEVPRPSDESYEFNYQNFNDYMYKIMSSIYK